VDKLGEIIESPYTALVVAIILGALALSGRLSVPLSQTLLFFAWVIIVIGVRAQPLPTIIGSAAMSAGAFLIIGYWLRPELVPAYAGRLVPSPTVLYSPDGAGLIPKIQIGQSGVFFVGPNSPEAMLLLPVLKDSQLKVEMISKRIEVSTRISDRNGIILSEIIQNEWKVAPPPGTWDRNYSNDALEVKDPHGRIVLQVRVLPDRIQLQGIWWIDMGPPNGVRQLVVRYVPGEAGAQFVIAPADQLDTPPIFPIFEYPSENHLGELRKPT
jgi:hypothetical protein